MKANIKLDGFSQHNNDMQLHILFMLRNELIAKKCKKEIKEVDTYIQLSEKGICLGKKEEKHLKSIYLM